MASFLNILLHNVVSGPSTTPFPFGETYSPDSIRGRVVIDPELCMGCGMCQHVCPGGAIKIDRVPGKSWTITVWHDTCCKCSNCKLYCPMHAVNFVPDWHSAHYEEDKFKQIEQQTVYLQPCVGCGTPIRVMNAKSANELYGNHPGVDVEQVRHMCTACRQNLDAVRTVAEARALKAAAEPAPEENKD